MNWAVGTQKGGLDLMKERKSFLLRLDPALYEALERWAQQELRSVNGQIEFLLRQAVRQHERPPKPSPPNSSVADRPARDKGSGPKS